MEGMMNLIKKTDDNGIEFYTVAATGKSGMSQSGLAMFAGIDRKALRNLEKTLETSSPSKFLEPFVGQDLTLGTKGAKIEGKAVGKLKVYKSEFCAAVLKHYSMHGPDHAKPVAQYSVLKFLDMGIEGFIQSITGWQPPQPTRQLPPKPEHPGYPPKPLPENYQYKTTEADIAEMRGKVEYNRDRIWQQKSWAEAQQLNHQFETDKQDWEKRCAYIDQQFQLALSAWESGAKLLGVESL